MSVVTSGYDLTNPTEFKAWCAHYPKAAQLLASIIRSWQTSNAKLKGDTHTWAAYPLRKWCLWTGLTLRTLERYLAFLQAEGLIRRERGQFSGKVVHPFIRPTRLALTISRLKKVPKPNSAPKPPADNKGSPVDCVAAWQAAVIEHGYLNHYTPTKTDCRHLKEAVAAMPTEHAAQILKAAVGNWEWFLKRAEGAGGEFNFPSIPSPAFLKKHVHLLVQGYMSSLDQPDLPAPKPEVPEEKPMTIAELEASLAEEDGIC